VDVTVNNGVARLGGIVWSPEAHDCAQTIARNVPGVTRVVDEMELEREQARGSGEGGG
jgi:osmotically-inducible protein OsmY